MHKERDIMSQKAAPKKELNVGIDLGTSRSAISASNGKKEWVESFVGWPKDFIARKVIGKPVLIGQEALTHRLSLDVHRPLERGVIKEGTTRDEEAVKELIRHLIELVQPRDPGSIRAVVGVPAESLKVNKEAIKRAVSDYVDSVMVVSEPFAVAYGMNALDNAMVIDIGAGTVDFCIMHGTVPSEDDQKTILTAGDFIDQQLQSVLRERYPDADFNLNMVRRFKEQYSFVGELNGPVKVEIPVGGKTSDHEITREVKRACESILPAIVETTAELIARFDPEYRDRIRSNISLAGGGSRIRGLCELLERELKEFGTCAVSCVDDPLYGGADGALALATDMPEEYWAPA
jgi:rod shape-determining protein MreB